MRLLFACVFFISKIAFGADEEGGEKPCPSASVPIPPSLENQINRILEAYESKLTRLLEKYGVFSPKYAQKKQKLDLLVFERLSGLSPLKNP
jgi:hypothetical protein